MTNRRSIFSRLWCRCLFIAAAIPLVHAEPIVLDNEGVSTGRYTAIAIRPGGLPIISYRGQGGALKVYDCTLGDCSTGDAFTLSDVGRDVQYTGIAIRSDGRSIISSQARLAADLQIYDCANTHCSDGEMRSLDTSGRVGEFNAIAVRRDGRPIVSYYDTDNDQLKIFDCEDSNCASGTARTLDGMSSNVGDYSSLAIRSDDRPIISYFDGAAGTVKAFDCADANCTTGTVRDLDTTSQTGWFTAIALRSSGQPVVSYYDLAGASLKLFDCDDVNCMEGSATTLDDTSSVGQHGDIAIRSDDKPIVSYFMEFPTQALKAFACVSDRCDGVFSDSFERASPQP